MVMATTAAAAEMLDRTRRQEDFMRQAVAAIDERTTDLLLAGAWPGGGDEPGLSPYGDATICRSICVFSPFHWNCRFLDGAGTA